MTVHYTAPGDMTVIAWHAWFIETDPDTDEDSILHYTSHNGDKWEDLPEDGCLGLRLIHAAQAASGQHYGVTLTDDWYFRAESNLGVIWGSTSNPEDDLQPGRYRNLIVKQGRTIPFEAWARVQEEMTNTVR